MTAERVYTTAASFRQALEARLFRLAEAEGVDLMRLRRQVAFDRLLARVLSDGGDSWALKGGYALELRSRTARTTRDIDLTLRSPAALPAAAELSTRPLHATQGLSAANWIRRVGVGPRTVRSRPGSQLRLLVASGGN